MIAKREHDTKSQPIELYSLPVSWRWGTVSDVGADQKNAIVDGPFGSNLKLSDYAADGTVPVLTTKNLAGTYDDFRYISQKKFEELKRSAVYTGDILMAKIGSCGKTGIYSSKVAPAMIPANLLKVSVSQKFNRKYVYYYFNSPFFQKALKTIIKATAQPAFGVTNFRTLPLPIAPLPVQHEIIAEIEKQFSRLDEAVAGLKRIKANLKRYKASVLKAAVEGKFTEEWRSRRGEAVTRPVLTDKPSIRTTHRIAPTNDETAADLLKRILAERKERWAEKNPGKKYKEPVAPDTSNLPELPEGWVWATTDQLFSFVTSGSRGWASYYSDSGPLFLRMGNLDHATTNLDLSDIQRVQPPKGTEGTRTRVMPGDILISITADVGMIGIVPNGFEEAYINQHVALGRPGSLNAIYLAWFLACKNGQDQLNKLQRGATKVGLGLDDIRAVNVSLPSMTEQKRIIEEIERCFSVAEEIEASVDANLKRAERLRQSILKKAFSGNMVSN